MFYVLLLSSITLLSWLCTGLIRRYAVAAGMFDVPSARSSHVAPTPRGGGLSIVLFTILGTIAGAIAGWVPWTFAWTLAGGGGLVALVGWLDDRHNLSPALRLVAHAAAAVLAIVLLGPFTLLTMGSSGWLAVTIGAILSFLVITWAISSYNFMDGIDSLAGAEAVWVGLVGGILAAQNGNAGIALVAFLIAASSAGFLYWNLPPARIFLGDVGSGFLGYAFVTLALLSDRRGAMPAHAWLILLGVFVFDSTATLLRRILRGEAWNATHRESAYQRAALRFGKHAPVTIVVLLMNTLLTALTVVGMYHPDRWPIVGAAAMVFLILAYCAVDRFAPVALAKRAD